MTQRSISGSRMPKPLHVAFVCTYNRARSLMGAAILEAQLVRRGIGSDVVRVSSAGTHAVVGGPADPRALRVLAEHGFHLAEHRATYLGAQHLLADLVVAMGTEHLDALDGADGEVMCLGVPNPCRDHEFENAYEAIHDAMSRLHGWVDERLSPPAIGWRFWLVRPSQCALRGPYLASPTVWPGPVLEAVCDVDRQHRPPAADCECGIYGDADPATTRARIEIRTRALASGHLDATNFAPPDPLTPDRVVLGMVELADAVRFDWGLSVDSRTRGAFGDAWPHELRGSSARIVDLTLLDDATLQPDEVATITQGLTARYGVPVTYEYDPDLRRFSHWGTAIQQLQVVAESNSRHR